MYNIPSHRRDVGRTAQGIVELPRFAARRKAAFDHVLYMLVHALHRQAVVGVGLAQAKIGVQRVECSGFFLDRRRKEVRLLEQRLADHDAVGVRRAQVRHDIRPAAHVAVAQHMAVAAGLRRMQPCVEEGRAHVVDVSELRGVGAPPVRRDVPRMQRDDRCAGARKPDGQRGRIRGIVAQPQLDRDRERRAMNERRGW